MTYLILGALGVFVVNSKAKEFGSLLFSTRKGASQSGRSGRQKGDATPKIFDTSVIIDGRIADILETGFIEGPIIIQDISGLILFGKIELEPECRAFSKSAVHSEI